MPEPLAYWNGEYRPSSQLALPVNDAGFVQGVAVSEQMRTFGGRLFRLDQHLERLRRSLEIVGLEKRVSLTRLAEAAQQLVAHNHALLSAGDDLGLSLFVTPGTYPTFAPATEGPHIGMHTYPLPFQQWVDKYRDGQRLMVSGVRQVPPQCWPPELKCRSRMHYYLADREAAQREPGSRALLLDLQDRVIEASTANVVFYASQTGIVSPPRELILPGVSLATLEELAAQLGLPFRHQTVRVDQLKQAEEVLLCSTSPCVWPVVAVDGVTIRSGRPGPIFERLISAWSELTGIDIRRQAEQFKLRPAVGPGPQS